ncbi:MAG: UDP-N-acetylmuramate--alanine ligase [Alphaproteobacteria bacterium]|nr:UDP-N-acetylmuramate--alanine ligase [Alphaproteobacteria bacterium]
MNSFFFCGIGGSGMLPLAMIMKSRGFNISGSDRSNDQGRTPEKFNWLQQQGIEIVPQDGKGLTTDFDALIVSSAVEDSIPEVKVAKEKNIPILKRAELLARIFNESKTSIAIAGTSGKSTTTGMLAWILTCAEKNPTVMNGANFLNFVSQEAPFASAITGDKNLFVSECDESDGSIILYHPEIAVLNNIALDHKPVDELIPIFRQYLSQSKKQVLNLSNPAISQNFLEEFRDTALTFGIESPHTAINITNYTPTQAGSTSILHNSLENTVCTLTLHVPGKHNVENATSAICAAYLCGVPIDKSVEALDSFKGVARRLENIGNINNINIIDDFAHNPDKIKATISSLKEHKGRLIIYFQMHGFGPLKLMKKELKGAFLEGLDPNDILIMPEVLYLGGTVSKDYAAHDFINEINVGGATRNIRGEWFETREEGGDFILETARSGDRIIIMGARDDTLTSFAKSLLEKLKQKLS